MDKADISVFRCKQENHPYPWRFSVTYEGVRHDFYGTPNQCPTRRSAYMRAFWRAKWLECGIFEKKYK